MANETGTQKYMQIKKRIRKVQGNSKAIGVLYLLATLAVTALACFQLLTLDGAAIGVLEFWKPFTKFQGGDILGVLKANIFEMAITLLYCILLLILLINAIRSFCKLGWLLKTKASKLYGFNRNMYAMDDMGKIFACSFTSTVSVHFLITVLGENVQFNLLYIGILLGVGVFFHFLCGMLAGNISLFTTDEDITEEKRIVGKFSPFVRNLLQIAAVAGIVWFFLDCCAPVRALVQDLIANGIENIKADPLSIIIPAAYVVLTVLIVCMFGYALSNKEFSAEGPKESGRKGFLWLSLLTFIVSAGITVYDVWFLGNAFTNSLLIIVAISFVMFILEICLRKFPKAPYNNPDEVDVETYIQSGEDEEEQPNVAPQILPPIYLPYGGQGWKKQ